MKIKESKNLKYKRLHWTGIIGEYEQLEPRICFLESFTWTNDKLTLYFKNGSQTIIRARNIEGGREMDLIERKLDKFLGKSYEEILSTDF